MPLELLEANGGNWLTVRPTDAGLPGAKVEVELDMSSTAVAGFVVFTLKVLSIPVLQKSIESMLPDEADEI